MGIHRHHGAADLGDLAQPIGVGGIILAGGILGHGLDGDHIARRQGVARLADGGTHIVAGGIDMAGPGELSQRDLALAALAQADLGRLGIDAQHHGELPAIEAGRQRNGSQRLGPVAGRVDLGDGPSEAMRPVVFHQPVMQHLVGDGLQARIEGGAHRQPALVERVLAEAGDQLAAHLLGEIIGGHRLGRSPRIELQRLGCRGRGFRGGDIAGLVHLPDHPIAPRQRRLGMLVDGVVVGRLGQRRRDRRFRRC